MVDKKDVDDDDEIPGVLNDLYHDFNDIDSLSQAMKEMNQTMRQRYFLSY